MIYQPFALVRLRSGGYLEHGGVAGGVGVVLDGDEDAREVEFSRPMAPPSPGSWCPWLIWNLSPPSQLARRGAQPADAALRSARALRRRCASGRVKSSGRNRVPSPDPGGGAIWPALISGRSVTSSVYQPV